MYLLPFIDTENRIQDGVCIKALSYCKKRCSSAKCKKHYLDLLDGKEGFYTCPEGLTSYLYNRDKTIIIFSGFRCKNHYNKSRKIDDAGFCPIICEDHALEMINTSVRELLQQNQLLVEREQYKSNLHEIRKLISQIKNHSESIFSQYTDGSEDSLSTDEVKTIIDKLKTIWISSCMVESRYSMIDYENNHNYLSVQSKANASIYKKFEKCSKVLRGYNKSHVQIILTNNHYKYIKAYSSFELIPLLLLENAVKYSDGSDVFVSFIEGPYGTSYVEIKSKGPYCSPEEINRIYDKGYRGVNAKKAADGSGIGLYFVKVLCELHNIGIEISSNQSSTMHGSIPYSDFIIKLCFHDVFEQ